MKTLSPPPHINTPKLSPEDIEVLKVQKLDKDSYAYKTYVQPGIDREKRVKRENCQKWWSVNWIGLSGLLIAVIALGVSVIALLK